MVNLTGGGMSGGYRKYLTSLVPLLRQDPALRLDVYVPPSLAGSLAAEGLGDLLSWPEGDERRGFRRLRQELRGRAPDVVFVPTARFIDSGRPCVVMVRNMEPLERPFGGNTLAAGLRNLARAWTARRACRRAARVIAVSQHVSRFLTGRFGLDPRKVGVVYHGVDPAPRPLASDRPEGLAAAESGRFLFTAGSIRPARGLEDLVEALWLLGSSAPPLLVAGAADPDSESHARRLEASVRRRGLGEGVRWLGRVGEAVMGWCYGHAAAFVLTSRAEACPNTALEAMAHGCLVLSTDQPPMPEMFGDAARYYRAGDGADLARRIGSLRDEVGEAQAAFRDRALRRAAAFTWAGTARRTVEVLEGAARGSGAC